MLSQAEKPKFQEEGKQALDEANTVTNALERRFGSSDSRNFKTQLQRRGPDGAAQIERIEAVARIVDRARRAELSRKYELARGLKKGSHAWAYSCVLSVGPDRNMSIDRLMWARCGHARIAYCIDCN